MPVTASMTAMRSPASLPLRLRVTLAFALSVALVLAGLGVFLYFRLGAELRHGVDLELRSRSGVITAALRDRGPVPIDASRSVIDPDESFAQVLDARGSIVDSSSAVRHAPMLRADVVAGVTRPMFRTGHVPGIGDPARLLAVPARAGGRDYVVVVGANLGDTDDALHRLLLLLLLGIPGAVLLASGVGWLVAGAALRPVERMRRDAAVASTARAGASLAVPPTRDELARLATTLNELLARERAALDAEHRFLDEASHDLRTPLAVLKAELDLALARPRDREELETTLRTAARATDRLVRLAEDLLVLARGRRGPLVLHVEPTALRTFCDDCAAPFQTAGEPITVTAPDEVVHFDPVRMRQAVRNLLDNAVRHGHGRGVALHANLKTHGPLVFTVSDDGPGMPADGVGRVELPRDGGNGLGLSIVAAVAAAHGGYAEARARRGGGTEVVIVVPQPVPV